MKDLPPDAPIDGASVETDDNPQAVAEDALNRFLNWHLKGETNSDLLQYQWWRVEVWSDLDDLEYATPLGEASFSIDNEDDEDW